MTSRLTDLESRAFAACYMALGMGVGANLLSSFDCISKKRAKELEELQFQFNEAEIKQIRSHMPDEPKEDLK